MPTPGTCYRAGADAGAPWQTMKVVRFYNRRGTAEQCIKEGKNAVKWTKPSCRWFKDSAARL